MIYVDAARNAVTCIGRLGENNARVIRINVSGIIEKFPGAEFTLLNRRPGDPDAYPVNPANVTEDGSHVLWTVTSAELVKEGFGEFEVVASVDGTIVKTLIYSSRIDRALDGSGEVPEPWESWVEQVTDAADRAEAAAEQAENMIDDTAGEGDTDRTWSADKIVSELGSISDMDTVAGAIVRSVTSELIMGAVRVHTATCDFTGYKIRNNNAFYLIVPEAIELYCGTSRQSSWQFELDINGTGGVQAYIDGVTTTTKDTLTLAAGIYWVRCGVIESGGETYFRYYLQTDGLSAPKINGKEIGDAISKGVDASISAGSTSTNLPTSQAVENRIGAVVGGIVDDTAGAGDTDKTWSADKTTTELAAKAPKANPEFTGSISMNRKAGTTVGENSLAVGYEATASGANSLAQGGVTSATGTNSHAEGTGTTASGLYSHSEGTGTTASGEVSHSEGAATTASGLVSHTEGANTVASGAYAHSEGNSTIANHEAQHAAGEYNVSDPSFTDPNQRGTYVEIIGNGTASNNRSNARALDWNGNERLAGDVYVGCNNDSTGGTKLAKISEIPDVSTKADKENPVFTGTISRGRKANTTAGTASVALGDNVEASGLSSQAFGRNTTASGAYSHAEGYNGTGTAKGALGQADHAEGSGTLANSGVNGYGAHAEGNATSATNSGAHAEGQTTTASGSGSHSEGSGTTASGRYAHAEGNSTTASGSSSHSEGASTQATGDNAHAEGWSSRATGKYSHAEGTYTIANHKSQHTGGEYNVEDPSEEAGTARGDYIEIIGNGTSLLRSNARALDWDGNERLAGDLYVGCNDDSTGGTKVATQTDISTLKSAISALPDVENSSKTGVDLDVSDEYGYVALRLKSGHIETEKFDSSKTINTSGSDGESDLDIADRNGFVYLRLKNGHIKTAEFDSSEAVLQDQLETAIQTAVDQRIVEKNNLYGLKWDTLGDSLTDVNTLGTGNPNYTRWISDKNGMSLNNIGVGGKGWWQGIEDEVANMRSDADVVTIFGSFNDINNYSSNPGTPGDQWGTGTTGYCARVRRVFDAIYAVKSDARIGVILPTPWINYNPCDTAAATQETVEAMLDALTKCCHIYSIPVLDLYHESMLKPWESDFRTAYYASADGYHPNSLGHKLYIAPRVEAFLRGIVGTFLERV